jgi:hydroxymethylbilane synthase
MGPKTLRIACSGSRLSLAQTEEALAVMRPLFPSGTMFTLCPLDTPGDRDKQTPLTDLSVPDDYFTRDLDQALLRGEADLAVHSAKDLPRTLPAGLAVAAILPGKDPRDALVSRADWDRAMPPEVIGTSSPRRTEAMQKLVPGARLAPLRGTIDERIAKLDRGEFDAIIVAACALERLGLAHRINGYLPYAAAPLQGRLAVTVRADADEWIERLKSADFRLHLLEESGAPATIPPVNDSRPLTLFVGTNASHFPQYEPMIQWPLIKLVPGPREKRIQALQGALAAARGVLFASPFAVRCFVDALMHWKDGRALVGKTLLAAGPSTAREIEDVGFQPAAASAGFGGLGELLESLNDACAGRYFYPCSTRAPTEDRIAAARRKGIELMPHCFYENQPVSSGPLPATNFQRVLFTSPSTVESYFASYPDEMQCEREWLAIGPSTLEALQQRGLKGVLIDES